MSIKIHILSASEEIKLYSSDLRSIAESTISLVEKLLSIKDVDLVFYNNPGATIDEIGGIGGFSPNANTIFISLNPKHPNFKKALNNVLPYTIAHELHHTIRWQKQVEGDTLLEAMIFEGLADHFAVEAIGCEEPLVWSSVLSQEQKDEMYKKAKEIWDEPTYDNGLWFFGSKPEIVPKWTWYTLGYDLVKEYLDKHSDASASKLVHADATLFI